MEPKIRWCDLDCPDASFPRSDALDGACGTFVALWCARFGRLVHKNARCLEFTPGGDDEPLP